MPAASLPDSVIVIALGAIEVAGGSRAQAARDLGWAPSRLEKIVRRARERGYDVPPTSVERAWQQDAPPAPEMQRPAPVSHHRSIADLLAARKNNFKRQVAAQKSREWMRFKVGGNEPFGLAFVGDPHADDPGCNFPLLERDLGLIRETPGMWGVGLGDWINNWSGRLMHKHRDHETTQSESWKLAEWMFGMSKSCGDSIWMLLLKGNHDQWSKKHGNGDPLDWMARGAAPLEEWQAKVEVACGDASWRLWLAHDFQGSSIYNPLHGPMRKAKFTQAADLYVCGDKHNWAVYEAENDETHAVSWAVRCRGYKYIDEYASQLGYGSQQYGATITAVFDPAGVGPLRVRCFPDLEEAAEFLTWKRVRASE